MHAVSVLEVWPPKERRWDHCNLLKDSKITDVFPPLELIHEVWDWAKLLQHYEEDSTDSLKAMTDANHLQMQVLVQSLSE